MWNELLVLKLPQTLNTEARCRRFTTKPGVRGGVTQWIPGSICRANCSLVRHGPSRNTVNHRL